MRALPLALVSILLGAALLAQELQQPKAPQAAPQSGPSQERIRQAIDAGAKYLKSLERNGVWSYGRNEPEKDVGCTALVGLALLVAGVPPTDVQLSRAAEFVRGAAPGLTEVYSVSLAIMFLDRYGSATDSGLIRSLALKLGTGMVSGGWSYKCGGGQASAPSTPGLIGIGQPPPAANVIPDNSNTQFAILALWIARRHGAPVQQALLDAAKRLSDMQRGDGGWGYGTAPFVADRSTPAMTCVGLLGIFLGFGVAKEKEAVLRAAKAPPMPPGKPAPPPLPKTIADLGEDKAVKDALRYLANYVGNDINSIPELMYFLWSLERVCVAYQFSKIGETDWYAWGAGKLLELQGANGSWNSKYGSAVDTSFALLFLCRADLVGKIRSTELKTVQERETEVKEKRPGTPATGGGATGSKPPAATPLGDDSARLAQRLARASPVRQEEIIAEYQQKSGVEYTLALAAAIRELNAEMREKARHALVARLQRLGVRSVVNFMKDEDSEIRRAAAIAARHKASHDVIPSLIERLRDSDQAVVVAAHESLRELTGKNFDRSAEAWEAWWKNQPH
jgi:hypothetical protein